MAILAPDKTTTLGGVTVKEYLLTKHNPNRIDMPTAQLTGKVLGVTIHNTDRIKTAAGRAVHPCDCQRQHEDRAGTLLCGQHLFVAESAAVAVRLACCGRFRKWQS